MEHVVFFPATDATPAFRRVASIEDAVRLVEHLRNVEGVEQVSVHALVEVPLSFRTVIKVDLPQAVPAGPDNGTVTASTQPALELVPDPAPAPPQDGPAEPDAAPVEVPAPRDVPAQASGGDGVQSLGFFA